MQYHHFPNIESFTSDLLFFGEFGTKDKTPGYTFNQSEIMCLIEIKRLIFFYEYSNLIHETHL